MSKDHHSDERDDRGVATEAIFPADGRRAVDAFQEEAVGRPRLRLRTIERTVIVRFEDAEILFEESAVRAMSEQLHHLIQEGHTRLLVNFAGVRYLSCAMLGVLASLQKKIEPARGRIHLCGLCPLLQDMVRITHLDRVFDVYGDEMEALDLMLRT
jgi:anti-sigma B factor antagonist